MKPALIDDGSFEAVEASKKRKVPAKIILLLEPVKYVCVQQAGRAQQVWSILEEALEDSDLIRPNKVESP